MCYRRDVEANGRGIDLVMPSGDARYPVLLASGALGVLDELRVPYAISEDARQSDGWGCARADSPSRALHWYEGPDETAHAPLTLHGVPIVGSVASEGTVAEHARTLGGTWSPWRELEVLDRDGAARTCAWRSQDGGTILPFDPHELLMSCRAERYRGIQRGGRASLNALARRAYYTVRPLVHRRVQIAARRALSRAQARAPFPRWPVEPSLHGICDAVLQCAADAAGQAIPYLAPWPAGRDWALVLTHDVETARGRDAIERVRAVEAAAGVRSSWNLVPERYVVDDRLVEQLVAAGCEVGVHGLRHDGRDLQSLATLCRRLPEMRRWASRWGAVGFRAPATHRVWEWMPTLGFEYDSSYPDTDPFEPIPGGCCWWLPFFNEGMVELPITLPQDHTLFVILRRDDMIWHEKIEVLRREGGMALLITHPDYLVDDAPLKAYERLLRAYCDDPAVWTALPREVSDWWRRRAATSLRYANGDWEPVGPAASAAAVAFVLPRGGRP
jgi:hypothetical protein